MQGAIFEETCRFRKRNLDERSRSRAEGKTTCRFYTAAHPVCSAACAYSLAAGAVRRDFDGRRRHGAPLCYAG